MQIRRKISLVFTLLTSLVMLCSFTFIYYLSYQYTKEEFYLRLQEKAEIITQKNFEEDELNQTDFDRIIEKNSKSIPEAFEVILNTNSPKLVYDSLINLIPYNQIKKLLLGNNIQFKKDKKQSVGIYYSDNQGKFIVVVSAIDTFGINKLHNLLKNLIEIFLVSILFIYFIGIFYSQRMLSPLAHILKDVNKIKATNLKLRLKEINSKDELGDLTRMLNQMLDRLDHSFTMQKNFIHNASHELKNPLTAIIGETEVALSRLRTTEQYVVTLNKISTESERLNQLTRNLLNIAQADFEITAVNSEQTRIDELLWEVKDYFDNTEYKNRIIFHVNTLPDNSKFTIVNGISNLLKTAFINIIDNACKFSDNEIVDVVLSVDDSSICVSVIDKGIGIPEKDLSGLFQPFFRASNTFHYKGSGVGLSLTEKIIKLHGGTIDFKSAIGKGTTVEVKFNSIINNKL
jgi:signal transduction histidine kinase